MGKCRHGSYAKSAVSGSCYQCKIEELKAQVKTAHREGWLAATANVRKTLELDQDKWLWMDTDDE